MVTTTPIDTADLGSIDEIVDALGEIFTVETREWLPDGRLVYADVRSSDGADHYEIRLKVEDDD